MNFVWGLEIALNLQNSVDSMVILTTLILLYHENWQICPSSSIFSNFFRQYFEFSLYLKVKIFHYLN